TMPLSLHDALPIYPDAFTTPQQRRRWVDFIAWYHQAIIDFAGESIKTVLKYFPKEKVRTKPGGNAGGVNPIAWGTYCPGYAKMASQFNARIAATDASPWEKRWGSPRTGIVLQPADWRGACFGDKWVATAYRFYGV